MARGKLMRLEDLLDGAVCVRSKDDVVREVAVGEDASVGVVQVAGATDGSWGASRSAAGLEGVVSWKAECAEGRSARGDR
jgi:hypothetical protein